MTATSLQLNKNDVEKAKAHHWNLMRYLSPPPSTPQPSSGPSSSSLGQTQIPRRPVYVAPFQPAQQATQRNNPFGIAPSRHVPFKADPILAPPQMDVISNRESQTVQSDLDALQEAKLCDPTPEETDDGWLIDLSQPASPAGDSQGNQGSMLEATAYYMDLLSLVDQPVPEM